MVPMHGEKMELPYRAEHIFFLGKYIRGIYRMGYAFCIVAMSLRVSTPHIYG